jgi:hypothetical protein
MCDPAANDEPLQSQILRLFVLRGIVEAGYFEDIQGYLLCFDGGINRFVVSEIINYIMRQSFTFNFLFYKLSFFI